jgi:transcriptional regulator
MFLPKPDRAVDSDESRDFLRSHRFGQIIASGRGRDVPVISPAPFVLEPDDTVIFHLATPNPIWDAIEENPLVVLAVLGNGVYIPGGWKAIDDEDPQLGVPTEYYSAVQLAARVELLPGAEDALDVLRRMSEAFESPGALADPAVHRAKLGGIRAARLHPLDVNAKFKYGGNVDAAHRLAVADRLRDRDDPGDHEARAALLRRLASSP